MSRKHTRSTIYLTILLLILAVSYAYAGDFVVYNCKSKGYSISFPKTWELKEKYRETDVIALSPQENSADRFRENVNVITSDLGQVYSLDTYYKANIENAEKGLNKFKQVQLTDIKINGIPTKRLVYTHEMQDISIKVIAFVLVKGKMGCVITCTALPDSYSKYEKTFDEVAKSFKF